MNKADIRFEVEVHLSTGRVVTYHVPKDRVEEIVARPGWAWPTGIPEDTKPFVGVFSDIANRVSKRTGFLQAGDIAGRTWLIRADSIVAFSVEDFREPLAAQPMGYRLPISEASSDS